MAAITINISNSKIAGMESVIRTITIHNHVKDYLESSFRVPYLLEHFDSLGSKLTLVPDVNYTLVADNIKRIWVRANQTTSRTYIADGQEFGLYDFFCLLQKSYTDTQIIGIQIAELDANGYFDTP